MPQPEQTISHDPPSSQVSVTRLSLLEQRVSGVETAVHQLTSKIDTWMTARSTSVWRTLAFCAAILVPLAFVIQLYITSAISPWAAMANQAKSASETNTITLGRVTEDLGTIKSQNADSIRDRNDQRILLAKESDSLAQLSRDFEGNRAQRVANEREVETQLRALESYENLTRTYNNRMLGLLWQKVYDQEMPTFQYNPGISDHGPQPHKSE